MCLLTQEQQTLPACTAVAVNNKTIQTCTRLGSSKQCTQTARRCKLPTQCAGSAPCAHQGSSRRQAAAARFFAFPACLCCFLIYTPCMYFVLAQLRSFRTVDTRLPADQRWVYVVFCPVPIGSQRLTLAWSLQQVCVD